MDKEQERASINDLVITQAGENKGFLEQVKQTLLIVQEIHYSFLLLVGKYEKGEETQKELLKQAEDLLKNSQGNLESLNSLKKEFEENAKTALEQLESLQTQAKEAQEAMEQVSKEFQEGLEDFAKEKDEWVGMMEAYKNAYRKDIFGNDQSKDKRQQLEDFIDQKFAGADQFITRAKELGADVISRIKNDLEGLDAMGYKSEYLDFIRKEVAKREKFYNTASEPAIQKNIVMKDFEKYLK